MNFGKLSRWPLLAKAALLIALMIVCLAAALMLYAAYGFVQADGTLRSMQVLQLLQSLFLFIIPCLLAAMLWSERPMGWLRLDRLPSWKSALAAVVLILLAQPGINLLSWLNQQLALPSFLAGMEAWMQAHEEAANQITEQFLAFGNTPLHFLFNLLLMALLPAMGEELCFRGTVQGLLAEQERRTIPHAAIWSAAILFSAMHMQFYGFVPRMLLGALFGYVLCWSGSLWVPMLMHFLHNALVVTNTTRLGVEAAENSFYNTMGTESSWWLGAISLAAVTVFLWYYRQRWQD